ncbi:hypothetical protein KFK09_008178 [Dendrobium nobile]|uniref:DUF4219 domain-containing protein n=1 Tax=Dendrobium nobile TaxID=94219 RepID=A0A8T3BQ65_DENNO|nr:hypothetical protein KFK09_008178 [Dendrobium nobile]
MPKQMPSPMKNGEKSIVDDVVRDTTTSISTTTRDNSMSMQLPLLTKMNYAVWAMKMEILMEAQGLWEVVEEGTEDRRKDKSAFAMICQAISDETLLQLNVKGTAKEAWQALRTINMGAYRVKKAKIQSLKREFEALRMRDGDAVEDFAGKLSRIVYQRRSLGEKIEESEVVEKLLRAVPGKLLQLLSNLEIWRS